MKKKLVSTLVIASVTVSLLAGCGSAAGSPSEAETATTEEATEEVAEEATEEVAEVASDEGKVINIYCWNDEFRTRVEAVYDQVVETSEDGTVTTLKDGSEIHWVVNPNQDGVYQAKLDEVLMNQANAAADDKVDIFLSETDYVFKYTDKDANVAILLQTLELIQMRILQISMNSQEQPLLIQMEYKEVQHGRLVQGFLYIAATLQKMYSEQMTQKKLEKK